MQRIEIKNFGPIEDIRLEIKDFSAFIGPQASGKSTIAKTICFFKSLNKEVLQYFNESINKNDFRRPLGVLSKLIRQKFLDYFGSTASMSIFELKYFYDDLIWISISIEQDHKYVTPTFSPKFKSEFFTILQKAKTFTEVLTKKNPSFYTSKDLLDLEDNKRLMIHEIAGYCNSLFQDDRELIFIPAGRSLLSVLSDQLQNINSRKLDFLTRTFIDKISIYRQIFNKSLEELVSERKALTDLTIDYEKTNLAANIIKKILKGKYHFDTAGERIFIENRKFVKLNFASSGQQESLWILMVLFLAVLEKKNVFMVIEEPEAHLFPEAQKEITNLIALVTSVEKSQVIITTHSPYILASLNNLILAHKTGSKNSAEVSKMVNKNLWIDQERVFAALITNGKAEDILDTEINFIRQEMIDSVSSAINKEFDYLLSLDSE